MSPPRPTPSAPSARQAAAASATTELHGEAMQVLREFRLVFNAVRSHFQQVEAATGLGGSQAWALSIVRDAPGIGVTDLGRRMDIHQSTASNLVRTLVDRGLIAAEKAGTDRRAVRLTLRPEGAQALLRAPGPLSGVLPRAIASLDPATVKRLRADLATLLTALDPDRRAARTPLSDM